MKEETSVTQMRVVMSISLNMSRQMCQKTILISSFLHQLFVATFLNHTDNFHIKTKKETYKFKTAWQLNQA